MKTTAEFRRTMNRTGFALALMLVLWQVVPVALLAALDAVWPGLGQNQLAQALTSTLGCYLLAAVPAWLVLRTAHAPCAAPEKHDLTLSELIAYAAVSIGAMFVFNLVGTGLNLLVSLIKGSESANVVNSILMYDTSVLALMVVVCAPIAEEIIFRGLLWRYTGSQGRRVYIVVSAVSFMLLHGNIVQYPYTFALGLIFALVYAKTGRLIYPVALHMIVNGIGGVAASFAVKNMALAALLGWTYIACVVAAAVLWFRRRDLFTLGGDEPPVPESAVRDALRCPGAALAVAVSLTCAALIIIFV